MNVKWIVTTLGMFIWSDPVGAQFPGGFGLPGAGGGAFGMPGPFMPNIYNPQTQPLSPYLNMFRGNPAVNYYYGTRPGTVAGMGGMAGGGPSLAMGGNRGLFFPQLVSGSDVFDLPEADPNSSTALPPAGHPVFFNNTMGYFPSTIGNRGGNQRPGQTGGGGSNSRGSSRR